MLLDDHLQQKTLAHAYFITGDARSYLEKLFSGPAYEVLPYFGKTGIDEVRGILHKVSFSSAETVRQIVLLNAGLLGREAKSALLKIVEEPPARTHFILYGVTKKILPEALASRLLDGGEIPYAPDEAYAKKAALFLKAGNDPKKREVILRDIIDVESLASFLGALEHGMYALPPSGRMQIQEKLQSARVFLAHPVPLVASIKDYITLLL